MINFVSAHLYQLPFPLASSSHPQQSSLQISSANLNALHPLNQSSQSSSHTIQPTAELQFFARFIHSQNFAQYLALRTQLGILEAELLNAQWIARVTPEEALTYVQSTRSRSRGRKDENNKKKLELYEEEKEQAQQFLLTLLDQMVKNEKSVLDNETGEGEINLQPQSSIAPWLTRAEKISHLDSLASKLRSLILSK
ncbi:MAG: hypothetical protein EZS28_001406 [Streblomastix strix]|uniref:Uncharacterized protein n=1 Tax=Streblomastix strix TaxID=222440 RepID=A0A5J4X7D2_9EUKA|nr:MAG: hypothetical protein EZS28_001406 [Streblomastix strix]